MGTDPQTEAARERFRELVPQGPNIELRPMFGTLAALVDGHVFALVMAARIGIHVDAEASAELEALPGSEPFTMGGRTMTWCRSLPDTLTDEECEAWLLRAHDLVVAAPPKPRRERRPRSPRDGRR